MLALALDVGAGVGSFRTLFFAPKALHTKLAPQHFIPKGKTR